MGCERCHGPGRDHILAARGGRPRSGIYSYGRASAGTIMELCEGCHRGPQAVPDAELESAVDLPRFQGTALAASKCYRNSGGRISCLSCHNPHRNASHDTAGYERVCAGCHSAASPGSKSCPVNPRAGCISMPTCRYARFRNRQSPVCHPLDPRLPRPGPCGCRPPGQPATLTLTASNYR